MAGIIIPLFTMRTFTFSGSNEVIIHKALDVRQWTSGTLMLRAHTNGIGSGSSIALIARSTAPSIEDPSQDFVYGTAMATATLSDSGTDPAPDLKIDGLTADFGGYLQIVISATKGGGACTASLSGELSMKD